MMGVIPRKGLSACAQGLSGVRSSNANNVKPAVSFLCFGPNCKAVRASIASVRRGFLVLFLRFGFFPSGKSNRRGFEAVVFEILYDFTRVMAADIFVRDDRAGTGEAEFAAARAKVGEDIPSDEDLVAARG